MKKLIYYLFFCIISLPVTCFAQFGMKGYLKSEWEVYTKDYFFKNDVKSLIENNTYSETKKLKGNIVTAFTTDEKGNQWMGIYKNGANGDHGLLKYNGKVWQQFNSENSQLPQNSILSLAVDNKGSVWAGTYEGMAEFDGNKWTIHNGVESKIAKHIAVDSNNNIWIGNYQAAEVTVGTNAADQTKIMSSLMGYGLSRFDGITWTNWNKKNSDFPGNSVTALDVDSKGNIWMGVSKALEGSGLVKFDGQSFTIYNTGNSTLPTNYFSALVIDENDNIWAGTYNMGLIKFDGKTTTLYKFDGKTAKTYTSNTAAPEKKSLKDISEPQIQTLSIDPNGYLWIGTQKQGIYTFRESKSYSGYTLGSLTTPLKAKNVKLIHIDKERRKWIITGAYEDWTISVAMKKEVQDLHKGYVMFREPDYNTYKNFKVHNTYTSNAPKFFYANMDVDSKGDIWFTGQGLVKYDGEIWDKFNTEFKGVTGDPTTCISIDKEDNVWVGRMGKGIGKFNGKSWKWYDKKSGLTGNNPYNIFNDSKDNVWVGNLGVDRFDGKKWTNFSKKSKSLKSNVANVIFEDSKGNIWVGTQKGLSKYDGSKWKTFDKKNNAMPGNIVYGISEDKEGNIWVATSKKVAKFNGKDFDTFNFIPGAKNYTPSKLEVDNKGRIWVGTFSSGVLCYENGAWKVFDKNNSGILFSKVQALKSTPNGEIWFSLETSHMESSSDIGSGANYGMGSAPTEPNNEAVIKEQIKKAEVTYSLVKCKY